MMNFPFANSNGTIKPFLTDPEFAAYEVTSAMLTDLQAKTTEFTSKIGAADEGDTHNTVDNSEINTCIKAVQANIRKMEKLVVKWRTSNPGFVEGFHLNSALDDTGVRHNGIEGDIKDGNGNAISNAVFRLKGTEHEVISDLTGAFRLVEVVPGDFIGQVTAEGFEPFEGLVHITKGKVIDKDFVLKKLA